MAEKKEDNNPKGSVKIVYTDNSKGTINLGENTIIINGVESMLNLGKINSLDFTGFNTLKSIDLSASSPSKQKIRPIFTGCTNLQSITLPTNCSVMFQKDAFKGCNNNVKIYCTETQKEVMLKNADLIGLPSQLRDPNSKQWNIIGSSKAKEKEENYIEYHTTTGAHIIYDGNTNQIKTNGTWNAPKGGNFFAKDLNFNDSTTVQSVDLSHVNTPRAKPSFKNCSNLKSVNLTGIEKEKFIIPKGMFEGCTSLNQITCSELVRDALIRNADSIGLPQEFRDKNSKNWNIVTSSQVQKQSKNAEQAATPKQSAESTTVKELKDKVDEQQKQIEALQKEIASLKEQNIVLMAQSRGNDVDLEKQAAELQALNMDGAKVEVVQTKTVDGKIKIDLTNSRAVDMGLAGYTEQPESKKSERDEPVQRDRNQNNVKKFDSFGELLALLLAPLFQCLQNQGIWTKPEKQIAYEDLQKGQVDITNLTNMKSCVVKANADNTASVIGETMDGKSFNRTLTEKDTKDLLAAVSPNTNYDMDYRQRTIATVFDGISKQEDIIIKLNESAGQYFDMAMQNTQGQAQSQGRGM